jgi:acyl carrier protein
MDRQVKLRGYRIELGEIEAVISDQLDVREAVVGVRPDRHGAPALVAYLTTESGNRINPGSLRTALRQRLPEYMLPAAFVFLRDMPLTPNGKIDRAALPDPQERRVDEQTAFIPPTTPTEQVVARIWSSVLGAPRVNVLDTFFDLGGHSLQAVEAIAATEKELGVRPNPILFQTQTLRQFAATCDAMIAGGEVHIRPAPLRSSQGRTGALRRLIGMRTR